jgi:hypothetical protein
MDRAVGDGLGVMALQSLKKMCAPKEVTTALK